jgi:hypothetical protein
VVPHHWIGRGASPNCRAVRADTGDRLRRALFGQPGPRLMGPGCSSLRLARGEQGDELGRSSGARAEDEIAPAPARVRQAPAPAGPARRQRKCAKTLARVKAWTHASSRTARADGGAPRRRPDPVASSGRQRGSASEFRASRRAVRLRLGRVESLSAPGTQCTRPSPRRSPKASTGPRRHETRTPAYRRSGSGGMSREGRRARVGETPRATSQLWSPRELLCRLAGALLATRSLLARRADRTGRTLAARRLAPAPS